MVARAGPGLERTTQQGRPLGQAAKAEATRLVGASVGALSVVCDRQPHALGFAMNPNPDAACVLGMTHRVGGDSDAGSSDVQVSLNATNGTMTLSGIDRLHFDAGDGTDDIAMTFRGSITGALRHFLETTGQLAGGSIPPATHPPSAGSQPDVKMRSGGPGPEPGGHAFAQRSRAGHLRARVDAVARRQQLPALGRTPMDSRKRKSRPGTRS